MQRKSSSDITHIDTTPGQGSPWFLPRTVIRQNSLSVIKHSISALACQYTFFTNLIKIRKFNFTYDYE